MRIFINPGHMIGVDPGACAYGEQEAKIVSSVGKKLQAMLEMQGDEVRLLQSDNLAGESPNYPNVTASANSWDADWFISLHCNAAENEYAKGSEVFVFSEYSKASVMAEDVLNSIVKNVGTVNRGVKYNPNFTVLKRTKMPAILVEMAFITNANDCQLLVNHQDELAKAIFIGLQNFRLNN